ncbi:hypothetical protein [Frigoribacterium endophyticum]|uniref:hypothetical protein n=1 Tax=Frigoribacterium endophyticum TaxID=1522176 RepID=UPI00142023D4|nr:hypothetical protein [Frigoribacterium endophyticum]NII52094.1 hypothetical protein [Frigoribacterium endophyticum]
MPTDDAAPTDPASPRDDDLDAWSSERHRELELLVARDREVEAARQHEAERAAREARAEHAARLERERRRREAELPPELRDADDEPWSGGPRRRLVMGSSRVLAAVALLAAIAVAVTGFL